MILYPTQQEIMDRAAPSYFYNLGTSSGKTLISIYHYLKHRQNEPLLIICPPAKKKSGEWEEEIETVENHEGITIDYKIIASSMLSKQWNQGRGYFVIFDEAHYFKNPTSQRGKAAYKLTKVATNYVLLTATAGEKWDDFINYFMMAGFYKNKTQFLKRHAIYKDMYLGNRTIKVIDSFRHEDELFDYWRRISISKPTEFFVDLPNTHDQDIKFKASKQYRKAEKDRVITIDGQEVILDTQMKLLTTLRYLTNQKDKLNYLKMILESSDENVVVFYNFRREANDIKELVSKLGKTLYEVNGQGYDLPSQSERPHLSDTVTLVQYQSGSEAIQLKYASIVVYYTPTYSYTLYEQSKGRTVRHGGQAHITFYNFKTQGTIETAVWKALKDKRDFDEKLYFEKEQGGH
jgi:superfamily II DNA or RNA helicase